MLKPRMGQSGMCSYTGALHNPQALRWKGRGRILLLTDFRDTLKAAADIAFAATDIATQDSPYIIQHQFDAFLKIFRK